MKLAVVLFNLGGPMRKEDIKPFLFNFFMDKNIIAAPLPLRYFIARYISHTRGDGAAKEAYAQLGYKSPLLQNTEAQAVALEALLNDRLPAVTDMVRVFVSMRYWRPQARETIRELEEYGPDKLLLLPLYPQYSTTTTKSSLENFWAEVQAHDSMLHANWNDGVKVSPITCYPVMAGFINASAELIAVEIKKAPAGTRILFSAHSLPEKIIAAGDPYQSQAEQTAAAVAAKLGLKEGSWQVCYQSRVGRLKWIGPSIGEALEQAARDKVGVIVYPHAFVSEHIETLVELDIEYREMAGKLGLPYYTRVPTVSTHPDFIAGLAGLVQDALAGKAQPEPCGGNFAACGCQEKK